MHNDPANDPVDVKSTKGPSFAFDFNEVGFSSQTAGSFRVKVNSLSKCVRIWVESKKNKQQWQGEFADLTRCNPAGIPEDAVYEFLQVIFVNSTFSRINYWVNLTKFYI